MLFSFASTGVLRRPRKHAVQQIESSASTQEGSDQSAFSQPEVSLPEDSTTGSNQSASDEEPPAAYQSVSPGTSLTADNAWGMYWDKRGRPFLWNSVTGYCTYQINEAPGYYGQPPRHMVYTPAGDLPSQTMLVSPGSTGVHEHETPWKPMVIPAVETPSVSEPGIETGREKEVEEEGEQEGGEEEDAKEQEIEPSKPQGTWEIFYNFKGDPVWIHSETGQLAKIRPVGVK